MKTVTVMQEVGSGYARVQTEFDPTWDAVCARLTGYEDDQIDTKTGTDEFGRYHPEFFGSTYDTAHILSANAY